MPSSGIPSWDANGSQAEMQTSEWPNQVEDISARWGHWCPGESRFYLEDITALKSKKLLLVEIWAQGPNFQIYWKWVKNQILYKIFKN